MRRHPRAILLAGVALLGIAVWLAWRSRSGNAPADASVSSAPVVSRSGNSPSSPDATREVSGTPDEPPKPAAAAGAKDKRGGLMETAFRLRARARTAVELALRRGGGKEALQLIRRELSAKPATVEDRLRQAFLTRLIAHVAERDPSVTSEALSLSGQILSDRSGDAWARFQAAAGLAGASSAISGSGILPDGTELIHFQLTPDPGGGPTTEFEASLVKGLRGDPATAGVILTALTQDPDGRVREASAWALGRSGATGSVQALATAVRSEGKPFVKAACMEALAELKAPELPELAKEVVLRESGDISVGPALQVLTRTAPQAPETAQFLADCLMSGKAADALPVLTQCAIQVQASAPGRVLQEALSNFLLQKAASDPEVVTAFVRETVPLGMTQFLPLFNVLASSLPEGSDARETLALGARQLQNAPYYVELAGKIQESEGQMRQLWAECSAPGTSYERGNALRAQIATLTYQLMELRGNLRQ